MNSVWVDAVLKNVAGVTDVNGEINVDSQDFRNHYGYNSLSHDFWVNLVINLDKNTRGYLNDNKLKSIEEVLKK